MAQVIGTYCGCFVICRELMKAMADNKNNLFDSADIGLGGNSTNPTSNALDVPLGLTLNPSNGGFIFLEKGLEVNNKKIQNKKRIIF